MVLARIPWVDRVWALPFLTVLAPSERYDHARSRRGENGMEQANRVEKRL